MVSADLKIIPCGHFLWATGLAELQAVYLQQTSENRLCRFDSLSAIINQLFCPFVHQTRAVTVLLLLAGMGSLTSGFLKHSTDVTPITYDPVWHQHTHLHWSTRLSHLHGHAVSLFLPHTIGGDLLLETQWFNESALAKRMPHCKQLRDLKCNS